MNECFELYDVVNLKLVDVRKYNGVEDGLNSWTFLGYDVVKVDREGNATSILAEEETCYEFLKPLNGDKESGIYDHNGILVGDVRVKLIERPSLDIFGRLPVVSKAHIKNWIDKRPGFSFLHYKPKKENSKVKKLGEKR